VRSLREDRFPSLLDEERGNSSKDLYDASKEEYTSSFDIQAKILRLG
jgi:hypothetical protein